MYQSVLVHSVTVSPLIVVDHAPEMVVKSYIDESMVMVEPSVRVCNSTLNLFHAIFKL